MPWPKEKTPDWGYETIGNNVISRSDLQQLTGQGQAAQGQQGEDPEEQQAEATPGRGPRRQHYYQAAVELMSAGEIGEEGEEAGADGEDGDELLPEEEEEEEENGGEGGGDPAVVAAER